MSDKVDEGTAVPGGTKANVTPTTGTGDAIADVVAGKHGTSDDTGDGMDDVERMLRSDYAGNSLLIRLMGMPLDAALRVRVDGTEHTVWRMVVSDGILVVHTNPVIAFAGPYQDGACVPYDVSCAIAATVSHRMLDGIVTVLPDGSVRDITTDELVCVAAEEDTADETRA